MAVNTFQRSRFHNEIAKLVLLVAFAAKTDAFAPGSLQSQTLKSNGFAARFDRLDLSPRKKSQLFMNKLRSAGTLEEYNLAKA
jgi:hypothetical protein